MEWVVLLEVAMSAELLFDLANLFVLPFWALMLIAPRWRVTQTVMASDLPFLPLVGVYGYFFALTLNAETAQALSNPTLSLVAELFADERAAAAGWAHFLVMDLFVGRWVYWQGQRSSIWARHSVALCLFAGPVGVLSHVVTRWIAQWQGKTAEGTPAASS